MSLSEGNHKNLQAMKMVEDISNTLHTTSWVWGGYTTDIYMGRILRDHDDVDYLTLNLHLLQSDFVKAFSSCGWHTANLVNGDLRLKKDGVKLHLGNVELGQTARWTHNGEKGSLLFPVSWLVPGAIEFAGIKIHVIAAQLQYILKKHPEFLNPDWVRREKDILEEEYLLHILLQKGVDVCSLRQRIVST